MTVTQILSDSAALWRVLVPFQADLGNSHKLLFGIVCPRASWTMVQYITNPKLTGKSVTVINVFFGVWHLNFRRCH